LANIAITIFFIAMLWTDPCYSVTILPLEDPCVNGKITTSFVSAELTLVCFGYPYIFLYYAANAITIYSRTMYSAI
jgi:hypothetical protein